MPTNFKIKVNPEITGGRISKVEMKDHTVSRSRQILKMAPRLLQQL